MALNSKLALTDQQKKVVFPLLAAVLLLSVFGYVVSYCFQELKRAERAIREENRRANAMEELKTLVKTEKELLNAFPKASAKNDVIKDIAGWARKEGLEVVSIDPKEETFSGANLRQLALTLNGKGGYLKMMQFIKMVETAPYFLTVSKLTLSGFDPQRTTRCTLGASDAGAFSGSDEFQVTVNAYLVETPQ